VISFALSWLDYGWEDIRSGGVDLERVRRRLTATVHGPCSTASAVQLRPRLENTMSR
jgi:hypothetical protein